jgi:hypothetical protein
LKPGLPFLLVFALAAGVRAIPELIIPIYPVGYETITYYAPPLFASYNSVGEVATTFFRSGPLFYVLTWTAKSLTGAHPYAILKAAGPLLYGCLATSFLLFLTRGLKWPPKTSLAGTALLVFQVAALRESWDRFRNILGLVFVFAALTALKNDSKHKWWLLGVCGVLTALSREYIAFFLFASVLIFVALERKDRMKAAAALVPGLTLVSILGAMIFFSPELWGAYTPNLHNTLDMHLWIIQDAFSILAICFFSILPLVVKGFTRDRLLNSMVGLLAFCSLSVTVSPWLAVPGYQRWMMLLVFPLSIYAATGLNRLGLFNHSNKWKLASILLAFVIIGVGYSSGAFSYALLPNSWVPTNLVQSSIPWDQVDDVMKVIAWLDENAGTGSCVLTEERFYGWTLIYLDRANTDVRVAPYGAASSPEPALERALGDGFDQVYLIWLTDQQIPGFRLVYCWEALAVFQY